MASEKKLASESVRQDSVVTSSDSEVVKVNEQPLKQIAARLRRPQLSEIKSDASERMTKDLTRINRQSERRFIIQ